MSDERERTEGDEASPEEPAVSEPEPEPAGGEPSQAPPGHDPLDETEATGLGDDDPNRWSAPAPGGSSTASRG